jgi:hypothetical protein
MDKVSGTLRETCPVRRFQWSKGLSIEVGSSFPVLFLQEKSLTYFNNLENLILTLINAQDRKNRQ